MNALLVVDVQEDFVEGGSLAVTGGRGVAERISRHLERAGAAYDLIVASRDWHEPPPSTNGGHFGDPPDFVDTWPVHCVEGTEGAAYAAELVLPERTLHVRKGYGRPDYSAFQGVTENGEVLAELLDRRGVTHLTVCGIATDHCVRASAIDALELPGLPQLAHVTVRADLCAGVDQKRSLDALQAIVRAGGTLAMLSEP